MANNRMYLVNKRTGDRIYLAKYYPSTGWYTWKEVLGDLNVGFHEADFSHLSEEDRITAIDQPSVQKPGEKHFYSSGGMYGEEWEIKYER